MKFRKFILLISCGFIHGVGISQTNKINDFKLAGTLTGNMGYHKAYLNYYDNKNGIPRTDSVKLDGGKFFILNGFVGEPAFALLTFSDDSMKKRISTTLFIEPSRMQISLNAENLDAFLLKGSQSQNLFNRLALKKRKWDSLKNENIIYDSLNDEQKIKRESNLKYIQMGIEETYLSFFKKYPSSYISLFLLSENFRRINIDSVYECYQNLDQNLQNHLIGRELNNRILAKLNANAGKEAYDFKTTNIYGDTISLSQNKNKYILVDFWASWCVPCRAEIPHLKQVYNKFHEKGFEIISISTDRDSMKWKKAVAEESISVWINVLSKIGSLDIAKKYAVSVLPTKFLIDKTGKIVKRFEGSEKENLEYIEHFLSEKLK